MRFGSKSTTTVETENKGFFQKDLLQPARKADETFEAYKARRLQGNTLVHQYLHRHNG